MEQLAIKPSPRAPVTELIHKYLRTEKRFPHFWCPGCGNGIVLGSLIRAVDRTGFEKDDIVLVSGIGCSGRMSVYVDFNTLHTTHGRALTFATGIKLVNPKLQVIVVMGDGDATAIGGNHFLHAARRNLNLTAIIINNRVYGMTGGQTTPTTPYGEFATTAPYGNIEHAFPIAELAVTAGASLVGRSTVYHATLLADLMEQAILKKGFSVVEVISHCPTHYGAKNKMGDAVDMLRWQKDVAVRVEKAKSMTPAELAGKITIGVLAERDLPIYTREYKKIREAARAALEGKAPPVPMPSARFSTTPVGEGMESG
jgi:2-oxoglutarate ferredoxin oxidoreductase subunit beta